MGHGILGGLSAIGTSSPLGLLDPTGQSWNNATYQACAGVAIQSCGAQAYQGDWPQSQLTACIESAQSKCIATAKAAIAAPTLTSAQVSALQARINAALAQYGYCPIGVDGQLGPQTCGASAWAVKVDPSISVPGVCGSTVKMGSGFLKDCAKEAALPPPPVVAPKSVYVAPKPAVGPIAPSAYLAPAKPKTSTASMLMMGGVVAGVAVAGYFVAKKKGWLK